MSTITKKVKFEYFQVVCNTNNRPGSLDTPFDLTRWIYRATPLSLVERSREYYLEEVRVDKINRHSENIWILDFMRMRQSNLPNRATTEQESYPLTLEENEFIGENVVALYDSQHHILMLQRNRYSLGPSGIETYLNLIWHNPREKIFLRPIIPLGVYQRITRADSYREIAIRFADLPNKEYISKANSSMKGIVDLFGNFDAINATVTINLGSTRRGTLNKRLIQDTVTELINNKDIVAKAELKQNEHEDTRVEVIDLFDQKFNDIIPFTLQKRQTITFEMLAKAMKDKYIEKRNDIIESIRKE